MSIHDPNFTHALNRSRIDERLAQANIDRERRCARQNGTIISLRRHLSIWLVRLGQRVSPLADELPATTPHLAQPGA